MATKYFKRTFIRPSTTVPFYTSDAAFVTAIENSATGTNSCIQWREQSLSSDELTLTWTSSWNADFLNSEQGIQYLDSTTKLLDTDIDSARIYCNNVGIQMSDLIVYTE